MKLEAGKYYRTADGRKAFIAGKNPFGDPSIWPWIGWVDGRGSRSWLYADDDPINCADPYSLVAEWTEQTIDTSATVTKTWRPYREDELKRSVPCATVLRRRDYLKQWHLVTAIDLARLRVQIEGLWWTPHALLNAYEHIDGARCGIEECFPR